eukprot:CAMPEP_0115141440 /NCGR_PEP_ID=MMETSP0227-20121206/59534_1 /TAXON_ID=89957 /ORGANISM="Polarella glacialis, Strain CCMP 1383" /LENGTH=95 /DNA_ID=CAMNT_0002549793 /DNA_START=137 /DNA_END=421 /DNA_ORIENTATION=-
MQTLLVTSGWRLVSCSSTRLAKGLPALLRTGHFASRRFSGAVWAGDKAAQTKGSRMALLASHAGARHVAGGERSRKARARPRGWAFRGLSSMPKD